MGKLETPLTWVLAILILGYFSLNNCYKTATNDLINNTQWDDAGEAIDIEMKIITMDNEINVDSILDAVLEEADSSLKMIIKVEDSK